MSDAYLEITDTPAGVGQGRYYFAEYDPVTGQDLFASPELVVFGPGGDPDGGGGGGGGGDPEPDVPSMTTEYIHADHLGSTRLVTDEMGLEIARYKYYPFGHYAETSSGSDVRMKFTGHERDESLGLDYMLARYYGGNLAIFLSVDPLAKSANLKSPQSWNRYAYVGNNPILFIDPNGEAKLIFIDNQTTGVVRSSFRVVRVGAIVHTQFRKTGVDAEVRYGKPSMKDFRRAAKQGDTIERVEILNAAPSGEDSRTKDALGHVRSDGVAEIHGVDHRMDNPDTATNERENELGNTISHELGEKDGLEHNENRDDPDIMTAPVHKQTGEVLQFTDSDAEKLREKNQ